MITPQEFAIQWQENKLAIIDPDRAKEWVSGELVRYEPAIVETLPIPDVSKRFLIEAGLPKHAYNTFSFDMPPNLFPPLSEVISYVPKEYQRYRLIGNETLRKEGVLVSFVCLDVEANGAVVVIIRETGLPVQFLNSSIPQLAEYFLILRRYREEYPRDREDFARRAAHGKAIGRILREIDPAAAANTEGWGSHIIEMESY